MSYVCFTAFVVYGCVFVLILAHSLYIQCALFSHFLHLRTSLFTLCTLFEHYMHSSCCTTSVAHSLHTFLYTFVNSLQPYCTLNANSLNTLLHTHCTLFMHTLHTFAYNFSHVVHYFYILCVPFQHFCKYFAPYQLRCILKGHLNCIEKKTLHFLKSEIHFFAFFRIFIFAVFLGQISRNMLSLLI